MLIFDVVTNPKNFEKKSLLQSIKKTKNVYLFDQSKSELKSFNELECLISSLKNIKIKKFYNSDSINVKIVRKFIRLNIDSFQNAIKINMNKKIDLKIMIND